MDHLGRIREEDISMTESSLQKSRKTYKKQKANSIVYGDTIHDSHQGYQQKVSNTSSKPLAMVRTDHNKTTGSQDFPKKIMSNEKVNYNHELHKLLSHHKKVDSYDKNISMAQKTTSSKSSKFFLNNSLKGFQFKHPGRSHVGDSVSKRSPSFSNSNLPTDLPSNKVKYASLQLLMTLDWLNFKLQSPSLLHTKTAFKWKRKGTTFEKYSSEYV